MKTVEHGSTYRLLQNRVMINLSKDACGQGREVKLQNNLERNYKNHFEILKRRWFEMKTLDNFASGMAPHKFSFALDSLLSFDYFWACEDGLWRRHPKSQIYSFVFQDLQYQRYNRVFTMINKSILLHLSKDVPTNEMYVFSSRYLRI